MEHENAYVKYISNLISKYLREELNPIEESELNQWVAADPENKNLFDELINPQNLEKSIKDVMHYDTERLLTRIKDRIIPKETALTSHREYRSNFTRYAAIAATVLIVLSFTAYLYFQKSSIENQQSITQQEIIPGGNKATLTLADGTIVDLSKNQNGVILMDNKLSYLDGTSISDKSTIIASEVEETTLVLTTPKGGQYQVVLPDGTKVWLNAASSLKYPSRFVGAERRVELSGEAYFEVSQVSGMRPEGLAKIPFIVASNGQEVKVLGTHFNINAYEDERSAKTTLLEGSVLVSTLSSSNIRHQKLIPGQQAEVTQSGSLSVKTIDTDDAIAWKEGLFSFKNENIQSVMKEFERWYNIKVVYEGISPHTTFSGKIYRSEQIGKVYALLDFYKIDYDVSGRVVKIKGKSNQ